jgi:Uma2 family endonuclease
MAIPQERFYTEEDYEKLPENIHAELIDGKIYDQAAPSRRHQDILMELAGTIRDYIKAKGGKCKVYPAPFFVKLFEDGETHGITIVEPDISVICDRDKLTKRGCEGAPDWIIEIVSPGNASHDYIRKLALYEDAGVREYWIVNQEKKIILVYHLGQENFEVSHYTFGDNIKAGIFEDLSINFKELDLT